MIDRTICGFDRFNRIDGRRLSMRKLFKIAFAAAAISAAMSMAVLADGWTQEGNTWVYYTNGYKVMMVQ